MVRNHQTPPHQKMTRLMTIRTGQMERGLNRSRGEMSNRKERRGAVVYSRRNLQEHRFWHQKSQIPAHGNHLK